MSKSVSVHHLCPSRGEVVDKLLLRPTGCVDFANRSKLAGMIYAMPTMKSELNAVINKPVTSEGYSGNYTGRGYSDMRFKFYGQTPADFDRWVSRIKAGGSVPYRLTWADAGQSVLTRP